MMRRFSDNTFSTTFIQKIYFSHKKASSLHRHNHSGNRIDPGHQTGKALHLSTDLPMHKSSPLRSYKRKEYSPGVPSKRKSGE